MEDRIGMLRSSWSLRQRGTGHAGLFSSLRRLLWVLAACVVGLLPGTVFATPRPSWKPGPPWAPLAPHSAEVNQISTLFWIMLILSGIIFIGVCFVLVYNIVNFTGKEGDPEPKQVFGNRTVEMIWTIIPTVILLVASVATVKAIHNINTR